MEILLLFPSARSESRRERASPRRAAGLLAAALGERSLIDAPSPDLFSSAPRWCLVWFYSHTRAGGFTPRCCYCALGLVFCGGGVVYNEPSPPPSHKERRELIVGLMTLMDLRGGGDAERNACWERVITTEVFIETPRLPAAR